MDRPSWLEICDDLAAEILGDPQLYEQFQIAAICRRAERCARVETDWRSPDPVENHAVVALVKAISTHGRRLDDLADTLMSLAAHKADELKFQLRRLKTGQRYEEQTVHAFVFQAVSARATLRAATSSVAHT